MADRTLVSLREFCRLKGWNPGYGHKLKEQGRLVMGIDDRDRECVDVEASIERLEATADPSKAHMQQVNADQRAKHGGAPADPPPAAGSANATFNQARTAREVYEAKTAEVEYRKAIGELVRIDDVLREQGARIALLREKLLALPSRIAPLFGQETDVRKIKALLDAELRAILKQVAGVDEPQ